eukprot:38928-Eustigmatos_ZCMA.PRE.1
MGRAESPLETRLAQSEVTHSFIEAPLTEVVQCWASLHLCVEFSWCPSSAYNLMLMQPFC